MQDNIDFKSANRENEANDYLQTHKVLELFTNLTSQLVFHKPGNLFKKSYAMNSINN